MEEDVEIEEGSEKLWNAFFLLFFRAFLCHWQSERDER
jgi:hypothetical protein